MSKIEDILGEEQNHPAYGQAMVSRVTHGKPVSLYRSSIKHHQTIRLRISRSTLRRSLSEDRSYSRQQLVEIEMSPVQWAELIYSIGQGDGVPCTILRVQGEGRMPDPPDDSKRQQFCDEFRDDVQKVAKLFDEAIDVAREMAAKSSVGKGERADFVNRLTYLRQCVSSNLPFVAEQFNEQMDRTVHEAKGEVDAFITNLIVGTGLEVLRNQIPSLDHYDGDQLAIEDDGSIDVTEDE